MNRGVGAWCLRLGVLTYQATLRSFLGGQCRFHPTCSDYALEAIDRHGAWRGGWLIIRRLCRCRPGGGQGYDPVPLPDPDQAD